MPGSMPARFGPWQLVQAGMPRDPAPCVTSASPVASTSAATVGGGCGGSSLAMCSAISFR